MTLRATIDDSLTAYQIREAAAEAVHNESSCYRCHGHGGRRGSQGASSARSGRKPDSMPTGDKPCHTAFRPCLYETFETSSVKTIRSVDAQRSTNSTPKTSFSTIPARASTVAATRSIASQALSRRLIPTLAISQLPSPRRLAMVGGSHGYRAALAMRQPTPERISSSLGAVGLPPFISSSTSCPEPGARCIDLSGGTGLAPGGV